MNQIVQEQIILSSGCKILTDFLDAHDINGWNFHQIIKFAFREISQNLSSFRQVLLYFFIGRTEKPAMIPTNVWQFLFCQDFTTNIFLSYFIKIKNYRFKNAPSELISTSDCGETFWKQGFVPTLFGLWSFFFK